MDGREASQYFANGWLMLPEWVIAGGAVALLLAAAFLPARKKSRWPAWIAASSIVASLVLSLVMPVISDSASQGAIGTTLFGGMVALDPFTQFFRVILLVAGLLGVLLASSSDEIGPRDTAEFYSLFLTLVLGMLLLVSASDLAMVFVALELVSLMSYVLAGFRRRDIRGAEAALKYVVYGGAASGVMLFGFSLLYGITGETQLSLLNDEVSKLARSALGANGNAANGATLALTLAVLLSFAGFAFKIAAAPLHMWSPDVYEGAPTPFTAFLSTGPKAAGFAALLRFFMVGFSERSASSSNLWVEAANIPWIPMVMIVSFLSMTLGNLAAIGQSNIKRFLAYSSIAHAGYGLIGLVAFSRTGAAAIAFYMAVYLVMNVGAFYVVIWVREKTGSERIDDYAGLAYRAPLVAIPMAICLFSLVGLPPFAGFIGKYYVFASVLERAQAFEPLLRCGAEWTAHATWAQKIDCAFAGSGSYYALAIAGVVNSAISLVYYARIVRKMFLERPREIVPIAVDRRTRAILLPTAAALIVFGVVAWGPLANRSLEAIAFTRATAPRIETSQR